MTCVSIGVKTVCPKWTLGAGKVKAYVRHPNTHHTRSIDYAIVLEIDMLMDNTEVR